MKGPEVELAYRFGREFWGRGYATEAAGACLRYGFEQLGLERIIAVTGEDHVASRRVMEKNGLTLVGTESYYGREMVKYAAERPSPPDPLSLCAGEGEPTRDSPVFSPLHRNGEDVGAADVRAAQRPGMGLISPEHAAFLERQRSGRLATVDPRGQPHAVPICYALLDGIIYTPIDEKPKTGDPRELRRIRNILANPKVCLVVDRYEDEDWSHLAWLQVRGEASLVEDEAERERALVKLRARYRQYLTMHLEELPLLRITPTRLVGWSWSGEI
jgi:PPOX class probable F420-dependent enzyme